MPHERSAFDDQPDPESRPTFSRPNGRADTEPRFKLVRFRDVKLAGESPYLVKGLLPREGLVVISGPPKCGKSFWTYDLAMHIPSGWGYRGRRVRQGAVVYVVCEGERGLDARSEAYRRQRFGEDPD